MNCIVCDSNDIITKESDTESGYGNDEYFVCRDCGISWRKT